MSSTGSFHVPAKDSGPGGQLRPTLGAFQLMLLGVGGTIGTGIFVLTSEAAQKAGPGMLISFLLAGVICAIAALCYAELAATMPVSGSAYAYSRAGIGESAAWLVGWALILEYAITAAAVAVGWSGYFSGQLHGWFGISLPGALATGPFGGGFINLPAVIIVALMTALLMRGTQESARFNAVLVAVKIAALTAFILLSLPALRTENFADFAPQGWVGSNGSGVLGASASIFFAYVGFDAVTTAAEETRNPQRNVPLGLLGALAICTLFYMAVAAGVIGSPLGAMPVHGADGRWLAPGSPELAQFCAAHPVDPPAPLACSREGLAHVLRVMGYPQIGNLMGLAAFLALPSVVMVMMYGQSRMFFAMARDHLLPSRVAAVHPKWGTPYIITLLTGSGVALTAAFLPIGKLADIANSGTLFAFAMVAIAVVRLRRLDPNRSRPFRVPALGFIASCTVLGCATLYFSLPLEAMLVLPVWSAIGLVFYLSYGRGNSRRYAAVAKDKPVTN